MLNTNEKVNVDKLEIFANGVDHTEGLTVTPDGTIYAGGEAGQIYRIDNDEPITVANTSGFMLGLTSDAHNRVYAIDNGNKCVWRYDPETKQTTKWLEGLAEKPLNVPNWGSFGPEGSYYLTDSGDWEKQDGFVWVKKPNRGIEVFSEEAKNFPNGCVVSRDGTKLYLVESCPSCICEIPITSDGTAGKRKVLVELGILVPDGIKEADDGSLIISFYRPDLVAQWSESTGLKTIALDPQGVFLASPTNFDFMGEDRKTMIFANLGRWNLTRANFDIAGAPSHFPTRELIGS
jgi:gluconolactonase